LNINQIRDIIDDTISKNIHFFWQKPIFAILSADDARFVTLKQLVSFEHLMPFDILSDARSVIVFYIPFTREIVDSNRSKGYASELWAKSYIETNKLILEICDAFETILSDLGFTVGKLPATHNFNSETLISNWSHRHIAEFAGIGSFGINNMIITDSGCCGRLGSFITNADITPLIFPAKERCLSKINGTCGVCQQKCPVSAYDFEEFNRKSCYEVCLKNAKHHQSLGLADVCGKCLVDIPCSLKG